MGPNKLADFIKTIDYTRVKANGEYKDNEPNPNHQLIDLERPVRESITFPQLKEAFGVFTDKVCVAGFPGRHSPGYWCAYSTVNILTRLLSNFDGMEDEMGELLVDTWVSLARAAPNGTHIELMGKLRTAPFKQRLQKMSTADLGTLLLSMKIDFRYDPCDDYNEGTYGSHLHTEFRIFFEMFTEAMVVDVRTEFLELYNYYYKQLLSLSPEFSLQIGYLLRDMRHRFPKRNPYLGIENADVMKSHLAVARTALMHTFPDKTQFKDHPVDGTVQNICTAVVQGKLVENLFDDLIDVVLEFVKTEHAREYGERVFSAYRINLFRAIKDAKIVTTNAMFEGCARMMVSIVTQVQLTKPVKELVIEANDKCFLTLTNPNGAQMKTILKGVNAFLLTGRARFILAAKKTITQHKKGLKWKEYMDEARQILDNVSKIPLEKMHSKTVDYYKPVRAYEDFLGEFLAQLKRCKALKDLQKDMVSFIFRCLDIGAPHKASLADKVSNSDYLDVAKLDENVTTEILKDCDKMVKNSNLEWDRSMKTAVLNLLSCVITSYDGNGNAVPDAQNELLISIFKTCLEGETLEDKLFPLDLEDYHTTIFFEIIRTNILTYIAMHQGTATLDKCADIIPDILKWAKIALDEDQEDLATACFCCLQFTGLNLTPKIADSLTGIMEVFLEGSHVTDLYTVVSALIKIKPEVVCKEMQRIFDFLDGLKEHEKQIIKSMLLEIAMTRPEEFDQPQVGKLFEMCKGLQSDNQLLILQIIRYISQKCPQNIAPFFPRLMDGNIFQPKSLNLRAGIIAHVAYRDEEMTHQAIDYLMSFVKSADSTLQTILFGQLGSIAKSDVEYMQKYKQDFQTLEKTANPDTRSFVEAILNLIEGKSYDDIFENIQQQQENLAELDKKVDVTANTVVSLGAHVIEQGKDISKVQTELDTLDERVDNVEDDIGETKIKVEEIDNKTMTNAPKWSRDLTKLMNPKSENDWRLLAKRLSYSNDDIWGWAQQHDRCMAVLSEWYATHKTSEANHAILTALQEMNRLDGVAIMENAMKASEGVVEDEDFEYPSPPPIFLSYQWGVQNEVKLLKQHLNMAGYECWMDIGQMGGGDKLFSKIDNGIRAAKIVICCTTEKYAQSPNCNREVNLSVNLGKPLIPLLMEKMDWPPKGAMGPIFSEYLFIRFFQRGGEETKDHDQRYWPVPKFQELLMQLNFFVVPDKNLVKKEYERWWAPIVEEIVIEKNKPKSTASATKPSSKDQASADTTPQVFLSYQWGRQPQIKALYTRLTSMGYTVWMDIYQMGGGDSLYDKIDRGLRGCKTVVSCITPKYALSANCRREVSLADALKKPIVPLLLEQTKWPPEGPMGPVFTELLYINMFKDPQIQSTWKGDKFDELIAQIQNNVPREATNTTSDSKTNPQPHTETKSKNDDKSSKQTSSASNGKQADTPKETGKTTQNAHVDKEVPTSKKVDTPKAPASTEKALSKAPSSRTSSAANTQASASKSCVLL